MSEIEDRKKKLEKHFAGITTLKELIKASSMLKAGGYDASIVNSVVNKRKKEIIAMANASYKKLNKMYITTEVGVKKSNITFSTHDNCGSEYIKISSMSDWDI